MKKEIKLFALLVFSVVFFTSACGKLQTTNSNEILVSAPATDSAEPVITSDLEGNLYILYVEHGANKTADVYLQKFSGEAKQTGERVRINPEEGVASAWRGDPPTIKIGRDGTVYIGWTARVKITEGSANNLYLSISKDGGKSFVAPVKVNDDKAPGVHGMHALEVDQTGRIFFAWLDERYLKDRKQPESKPMPMNQSESSSGEMKHQHAEPNREVYFTVSTDGGKSFSANKRIAENVCPCCKISMTTAPDGRLYVSWRQVLEGDFRHIAVSSSIDGGNTFSPFTIVSNDQWQISGCPVSGAAMTVNKNNSLQIIWFTAGAAGTPGIYSAQSSDGGKSFAPRQIVSDQGASGTPVIMQDAAGNSQIVFSAVDKTTYFLTAKNAFTDFTEVSKVIDADLPSATIVKGKVFFAFIRKVNDKRNIFLLPEIY
jgi:hypothetical protein